ncbi:hypothetical protein [Actinospongicola halichondriae]|uniref:hypothetical protein n=1 Tax=Actinospongicola halichondriae TaxID=3236844 RepID=UPI003D541E63
MLGRIENSAVGVAILSTAPWMLLGQILVYINNRGEASEDSLLGITQFAIVLAILATAAGTLWTRLLRQSDPLRSASRWGLLSLATASFLIPTVLVGVLAALVLLPTAGLLIGLAGSTPNSDGARGLAGSALPALAMGALVVLVLSF